MTLATYCTILDIDKKDIKGKSRKTSITMYRHVFCYIMRDRTDLTLAEIGKIINRNHATVLHSTKTVKELLEVKDKEVEEIVSKVKEDSL